MIHAVVYTKPNCVKCKMTMAQLTAHMRVKQEALFTENDDWSEKKLEKFKAQGYLSMPVVRIYDGDKRLDDWSDFEIKNIKHWNTYADENS